MNETVPSFPLPLAESVFPTGSTPRRRHCPPSGSTTSAGTPLQAAMVTAAIANDGEVMLPYLVQELRAPNLVAASPHPAAG